MNVKSLEPYIKHYGTQSIMPVKSSTHMAYCILYPIRLIKLCAVTNVNYGTLHPIKLICLLALCIIYNTPHSIKIMTILGG